LHNSSSINLYDATEGPSGTTKAYDIKIESGIRKVIAAHRSVMTSWLGRSYHSSILGEI